MKIIIVSAAVITFTIWLGVWWYWQANYAEHLVSIPLPKWIMSSRNPNVSYSLAIHKSQIKPYGTVWEMSVGDGVVSNFPHYTREDDRRYAQRHKPLSPPDVVITRGFVTDDTNPLRQISTDDFWIYNRWATAVGRPAMTIVTDHRPADHIITGNRFYVRKEDYDKAMEWAKSNPEK